MARKHRFESSALQYLYDRYVGEDPAREAVFEEELVNAQVARAIYDLRTQARLTQAALAKLIRTSPSVISRIEDANYRGHSLGLLQRIAAALDRRVVIGFVPRRRLTARRAASTRRSPIGRKTGTR